MHLLTAIGLPKKLDGDELFDVYHSHTKSCTICQAAEKKMKIIRNLAVVGAGSMLMGLTALLSRPVARLSSKLLVGGLGAAFGAVALLLNKMLPMFHKFEFNHQDNK